MPLSLHVYRTKPCRINKKQNGYETNRFLFTLSLAAMLAHAQLTLEECQRRAQDNYPLVRQYGLIEKARGYDLSNAGKGYLPQFSLSGKATYQSDITRLPVEIPNLDIETVPKDQYQVMLEVQQVLWDGGDIRSRKRLTRAASEVELEKQHVDMYALTDRVNQLFSASCCWTNS